jgi:hypothetical protein
MYKAKKTRVAGHNELSDLEKDVHEYDSRQEGSLAMLLLRERIGFTPHQKYDVVDRDGNPHTYEVDFDLHRPHKLKGISHPISLLEYKGVFKERDKERMDWLEFATDRNGYIVNGTNLLDYWSEQGMKDTKYKNGGLH